ncbi:MAG: 2-dehydropantoate 2-reductase [Sphaerobacter sp.]|nr:2-dehydropantoate 2-reductase [Sphaerobacter sp.]
MPTNPAASLPPTLVYGAGAVGCLLGGLLAAAGAPVTLLARPGAADAVREHGLRLVRPTGERRVHLPVTTSLDALPSPPALVLLTIKADAVPAALPDLRRLAGAGAAIVTLQNGVGTEETVRAALGSAARLAAGVVTVSVVRSDPATVRQETAGGVALAPVQGDVPLDRLAAALTAAGLPTSHAPRYPDLKWSKLLLNMMANATAALLALPPAAIYGDPPLFQVERAAFIEALAVMLGAGVQPIALPGFNVPLLVHVMRLPAPIARRLVARRAARGRGEKRPSLWLDLDRGRGTTEVRWLNGAVADQGARLGIPTPVNARLTALVEEATRDPAFRRALAGQPAALLAALAATDSGAQA